MGLPYPVTCCSRNAAEEITDQEDGRIGVAGT